ncbi:MAG: sigma-E factor negative regulatory protein [Gammaproteobacteria bacterium]
MTDTINSQISAFIDDELMDEESGLLVRRLCNDETLRQTAARYTLIGDAVRGSLDEIQADLNGSIMRAIEHEPAPTPALEEVAAPAAFDWKRLAGGGAVAATVAVMAVLALRTDGPAVDAPAVTTAQAFTGDVVPTNDDVNPLAVRGTPGLQRASNQTKMSEYLLRHNEYSKTMTRQGTLVYGRVTGESEQEAAARSEAEAARVRELNRQRRAPNQ